MRIFEDNILGNTFVCTDIETTGLDHKSPTAGIVEVYMEKWNHNTNKIIESHHSLHFHPNHADTYFAHKIEEDEFDGTTMFTLDERNKKIYRDLILECCDPNKDTVFMSYYVPFEYAWFKEFLGLTDEQLKTLRVCDPRYIAKILYPDRSHSLVPMAADFLGVTPEWGIAFHRSADDTKVMKMVYDRIIQDIKETEEFNPETYYYDYEKHSHDHD